MASDLDWTKFREIILTPLIDIDNPAYLLFTPLWSLMTKGEKNKDISDRGRNSVIVYSEKIAKGKNLRN